MVWIPGGVFRMGSDVHYPEEAPSHRAKVDGFWMDRHTVTNADFARFVAETGYVTVAGDIPWAPNGTARWVRAATLRAWRTIR